MIRKIGCSILLLLFAISQLSAKDIRKCKSTSTGTVVFLADSIDFRSDLTRVYGRISGVPHTSGRIDTITLQNGKSKTLEANDIDGVDFQRWFQWEDDGIIPLEIDFPPIKPISTIKLKVEGPKGESLWKIKVGQSRKKRR